METMTKEIQVYIVEDKEFLDKKQAEEYENQLKKELNYTYYIITHKPDLTEGRGYYKQTTIAVPNNYAEEATALKFCFDVFGSPLAFVQGVCATPNWILNKGKKFNSIEELNKYKQEKLCEGIGDYTKRVDKKIIYLDSRGNNIE